MYPDQTALLNSIQRSNIRHNERPFVIKAVQEYFKTLYAASAIKVKSVPAKTRTRKPQPEAETKE